MSYIVKKIFGPTIQGEGSLTGTQTLFVRLSGCNMWDGRPETRAASRCPYCDTDFFKGDRTEVEDIVQACLGLASPSRCGWVTISGGEPMLQLGLELLQALSKAGYKIAVETNGTKPMGKLARLVDHISLSPKVPLSQVQLEYCDDLKVLFPHPNEAITPQAFSNFPTKRGRYIQPINGDNELDLANVAAAMEEANRLGSRWKLSVQVHKPAGLE